MNTWCLKHVEDTKNCIKTLIWSVCICWFTLHNSLNFAVEWSLFCYTKVHLIRYKKDGPRPFQSQNECFTVRWTQFSPNGLNKTTCKWVGAREHTMTSSYIGPELPVLDSIIIQANWICRSIWKCSETAVHHFTAGFIHFSGPLRSTLKNVRYNYQTYCSSKCRFLQWQAFGFLGSDRAFPVRSYLITKTRNVLWSFSARSTMSSCHRHVNIVVGGGVGKPRFVEFGIKVVRF
jgi:hypothetical protein